MKQYLDIVRHVLENGKEKRPVRRKPDGSWEPVDSGVMTLACPNVVFSHDMCNGFPLLTTKKMAWKNIRVELEGFIKGITSKKWYKERGCHFWDYWANPQQVEKELQEFDNQCDMICEGHLGSNEPLELPDRPTKKEIQAQLDDLGPFYAYQWRNFDGHYSNEMDLSASYKESLNGVPRGVDQLKNIVDTLQNNPMDRRMVCSAWNPNQMNMMSLPPCHYSWGCTVIGDELHLNWTQRSVDVGIGLPANIASYGLLLCLLAEVGGFKRGNLSGMLVDCHIYENQIDAAREQITREPQPLPMVGISTHRTEDGRFEYGHKDFDIFKWTHKDVDLQGYNPLEKIDFGKVVV